MEGTSVVGIRERSDTDPLFTAGMDKVLRIKCHTNMSNATLLRIVVSIKKEKIARLKRLF